MKNKNGFTLIELLAIIIIIAIIAVITIPKINKLVENSRREVIKDSAYGFKKSVDNFYYTESFDDSGFEFDNKRYSYEQLKNLGISVSGNEPSSSSWVDIVDDDIVDGCLQFNNYMVPLGYDYVGDVSSGQCDSFHEWSQTVYPTVLSSSSGTTYYDTEWIKSHPVYYNPVDNSSCSSSESSSLFGTSSGCMKWYAYSESNGKVNLLLDHNLTNSINWVPYFGNGQSEIEILMGIFDENTHNWNSKLVRDDSYNVDWEYNNTDYSASFDYSNLKARFLTAEEIAELTGNSAWTIDGASYYFGSMSFGDEDGYYFQNSNQRLRQESFSWLFDNTDSCDNYGCDNSQADVFGYWTSSPKTNTSNDFWCVCNGGCVDSTSLSVSYIGLRPVISVSKSVIY